MMNFGKTFQPNDKIGQLPFNIQQFLGEIQEKHGYVTTEDDTFKKTFDKKRKLSVLDLLNSGDFELVKKFITGKKVVVVGSQNVDDTLAVENTVKMLSTYGVDIERTISVPHGTSPVDYKLFTETLNDPLYAKDHGNSDDLFSAPSFDEYVFICVGPSLKNQNKIKDVLAKGGNIIAIDHTRVGNDYLPVEEINYLKDMYSDQLVVVNPYLSEYDNKSVSNSVMITKTLSVLLEGKKVPSKKSYDQRVDIFNGLTILSDRNSIDTFENRILAQNCIAALNEPKGKSFLKKLDLLKQALKIDEFDMENVNTKLIPFIYGMNSAYDAGEFDADGLTQELQWHNFSEVIDFLFEDKINESEYKQVLRTVMYVTDRDRTDFGDSYVELQKILGTETGKNVILNFDPSIGKLDFGEVLFPNPIIDENGNDLSKKLTVTDVKRFANKLRSDSFKNVCVVYENKESFTVNLTTYEKYGAKLKEFVKKNKTDILKVSGEDYNYSISLTKDLFPKFIEFVNKEMVTTIGETEDKDVIKIKDFSYLDPNVLSIIKRDLGLTNPAKLTFGLKGDVYKFEEDAQNKIVVIRDEKGNRSNISVNDYYFEYLKNNYPIGSRVALHLKASLRTNSQGEIDNAIRCVGIGLDDVMTFKKVKDEVMSAVGTGTYSKDFKKILASYPDKSTYEIALANIRKNPANLQKALFDAQSEITELHRVAEIGKAAEHVDEIKLGIQDFLINRNQALDTMLNREKDRLMFGGTHILPFLIKDGNEIFLSSDDDRKTYDNFVNKRNNLFFRAKELNDWFEVEFMEKDPDVINNLPAGTESIAFVKELKSRMEGAISQEKQNLKVFADDDNEENDGKTRESRQKEINKSLGRMVSLMKNYNEVKTISSDLNSLRTSVKNNYYARYSKKNALRNTGATFTDLIFNKEKSKLSYHSDKFNDRLFYTNFYDSIHFVNTVKMVFGDNPNKMISELVEFLNANNYNSVFDTFMDVLDKKLLPEDFDYAKLVSGLSVESKIRLVDMVNDQKNSATLTSLFNIDFFETDQEKIKMDIFGKLGLTAEYNNKKSRLEINDSVLKKLAIENKMAEMLKNGKKPDEIISWLVDGEIDGVSVTASILKGLTLTKYLDTGYLMLAYIRDLGVKGSGVEGGIGYSKSAKLLPNQQFISTLSKDLLFMKNADKLSGGARTALKILNSFKNKDTIVSALNKEMSLFLSDTDRTSANKNKSIAGYFKDIFNIYGLQSSFIAEQLVNSAYLASFHEELKKVSKELKDEYTAALKSIAKNPLNKGASLKYSDFLRNKINSLGTEIDENGKSAPAKTTVDNHNIGLRRYGLMKMVYKMESLSFEVSSFEDVRTYVAEKLAGSIDYSSNNYVTSQSESFFIFNIQRKLFDGFNIQKARDISYKDVTKEIFSLVSEKDKDKLYALLSKTNSYGKNLIPDFVIRNKVGNIVGVGEIFGGHSDESENYEEVRKIKTDILNIFKKSGINVFYCDYDEKNKNGKINEYLYSFNREVNKGAQSIARSVKDYENFVNKNGLDDIFENTKRITPADMETYSPLPLNKLTIQGAIEKIENGRVPLFFDTETTGFARKTDPNDFRGASIFQLAYSDRSGKYVSKEFKEIKGPLVKKIEDLTHRKRSELLRIGRDPIEGITDLMFEIIGPEMEAAVKDPSKIKNLRRSLERHRNEYAILVGHNSFAFDAAMLGNMIKYLYSNPEYDKFFKENPGIRVMYRYFVETGFDMGDTLNYSREILNPDKNAFLGDYALGNENNKLGNLYKLSQLKKAELEGKNMATFSKELDEKIAKFAHNAQFDIEMTKEFYEYAAEAYKKSEQRLNVEAENFVGELKKGGKVVEDHENFLQLNRKIKEIGRNIKTYNELIKQVVLYLGKMDIELEYGDGKLFTSRISDYSKITYDADKVRKMLENYGISREEIEDAGLIKEVITKKNAKILTDFIKNMSSDDTLPDVYDYLEEKLFVMDHMGRTPEKKLGNIGNQQIDVQRLLSERLEKNKDNNDYIVGVFNELILKKETAFKERKKLEIDFIRRRLIIERGMLKLFQKRINSPDEYNKLKSELIELGVGIQETENRLVFNYVEPLNEEDYKWLDDNGLAYETLPDGKTLKILDADAFNNARGLKWAQSSKLVAYAKSEGKKDVIHVYRRGSTNGSYTLRKMSVVNVDKMKDALGTTLKFTLSNDEMEALFGFMVDRIVKNKKFSETFKNPKELFEGAERKAVEILRGSTYTKNLED